MDPTDFLPIIVGGEETADYPAVVGLYAANAGAAGDFFCSGTLVAPDAVVTCAHCVDRLREYEAGEDEVSVLFGTKARGGIDSFAHVIEAVQHPDWVAGQEVDEQGGTDIAVLRLDRSVPDVEPMPVFEGPVDESWVGIELDFVGWGATTAEQLDGGVKRHVAIPVSGVDDLFVHHGEAGSGLNTCFGDSGGTVLRTFDDGVTRLVAVPSVIWRHTNDADICTDGWGWDLRVDVRRSFIEDTRALWAAEPDDTDDTDAGEAPAGCGCASAATPPPWTLLALLGIRRRLTRT